MEAETYGAVGWRLKHMEQEGGDPGDVQGGIP